MKLVGLILGNRINVFITKKDRHQSQQPIYNADSLAFNASVILNESFLKDRLAIIWFMPGYKIR